MTKQGQRKKSKRFKVRITDFKWYDDIIYAKNKAEAKALATEYLGEDDLKLSKTEVVYHIEEEVDINAEV